MTTDFRGFVFCLLGLFLLSGCSTNPATGARQFTAFMSPQQEVRVGASEHEKIVKQFGLYDHPALIAYVNDIGRRVTASTERPDVQFKFFVIDSPIVNAFALPGGYVYVSRGLVALARNEAELAAVLAHEAAHITARHSAERYSHGVVTSLGTAVLAAALDDTQLGDALNLGSNLYLSSYSRGQESEADQVGLRYLSRGGYDVSAMASFLSALERYTAFEAQRDQREQQGFSYFSTHPATADRVQKTRTQAAVYQPGGMLEQSRYYNKIDGIVFGDNIQQGFTRGQKFYHPKIGFGFDFPQNYRLINQPDQIVVKRADGPLAIFDLAPLPSGASPLAYLRNVWMKNEKLQGVQSINVNGFSGAAGFFEGRVNGRPVTIRLVTIAWKPNQVARFQMAIPRNTTELEIEELKRMTYSFHALKAGEAQQIQPYRLKIREVRRLQDLKDMINRQPLGALNESLFLTLNAQSSIHTSALPASYKFVED